jgi:GNAT superfamily N-acetyltransferase
MALNVNEIISNKDLRSFVQFPSILYRGNPYWVPSLFSDEQNTLRLDKNPAFEYCQAKYWLAYEDGKVVGRVAAILNRKHIQKWNQRYLRFGWLDFIDDPTVSSALMGRVEAWARQEGLTAVHGPLGFTDLDKEGMLVEGFTELSTMATMFNYPYYPQHMERLSYGKDIDWVEYEMSVPPEPNETIARIASISLRRNKLKVLELSNKKQLLPLAEELFELFNEEYKHLYGVVPLSDRQVQAYIKQYFGFINPDFVPLVADQSGRLVAFGIVLPSLSKALQRSGGRLFPFGFAHILRALKRNDRADLMLVAVRSEYKGKGVNAILMDRMHRIFNRMGITKVESNPELETNADVQGQWKYYDRRQHKRRRIFIKHLG